MADLPPDRPNILIIVTDDQTWSTFSRDLMPNVFTQLVDKGALFTRGYVNESLCCPSRAQILTGLFGQHTGVDMNDSTLDRPTIVAALHDLGYRTGLSGKYLNSWPCTPRAEFDDWFCSGSGKSGYTLVDPLINVNGSWIRYSGYTTDIEALHALDFINSTPNDQPFFAMYTPTSPHLPADDPRCASNPVSAYRPPSYDEDTQSDGKPFYMQRGPLSLGEISSIDHDHQVMTEATECLDGSISLLLDGLGDREQDTIVFFLSDNGYLYGEHRRQQKQVPYEESVRIPYIVRYPPLVPESQPVVSDALVENVDIAATIADLLGIHWGADGITLVPILSGQSVAVRQELLTEFCEGESFPCPGGQHGSGGQLSVPSLYGATTSQYVYLEYWTGEKELYDLVADPYELENVVGDPSYAAVKTDMAQRLSSLEAPPITDTTIVTGPAGLIETNAASFTYFSQSRFATYECRLDIGGVQGQWSACGAQAQNYSGLADGDYVFNVRGTDEYGEADLTPESRPFSVDLAPTVTISSGPPNPTDGSTARFDFTSSDPSAMTTCSLDGSPNQDCSSGVTYTGVGVGLHTFRVQATDLSGVTGPPATWTWTVAQVTAFPTAKDFAFTPKSVTVNQGTAAKWTFDGPSDHTVTDGSGLGLFDSGPKGSGSTFMALFSGAGNYSYKCTLHAGMTGTVRVPLLVSPPTGGVSTQFTVTWASAPPPPALVYDVQIKRPGSTRFVNWKTSQTGISAVFTPDAGTGVYSFKARVRNSVTKAATKYSAVVAITVS